MTIKSRSIGSAQIILGVFLLILVLIAYSMNIEIAPLIQDAMIRLPMNGVLVLSLLPMLRAGLSINFGLPVGIIGGLIGMCIAIEFELTGLLGFTCAVVVTAVVGTVFGYIYSKLIIRAEGKEEIASNFIGLSFIPLACIFWVTAPFTNPSMIFPVGGEGLRTKIGLEGYFKEVLNNFLSIDIGSLSIPFGFILVFLLLCLIVKIFFITRIGLSIIAVGENKKFSYVTGLNINKCKIIAVILSTILAGIGICFYSQSYGFVELYNSPSMMAFSAASSILIGGYMGKEATITQVILGTFIFQSIFIVSVPISNQLLVPELAEIIRTILTNTIILYAMFARGKVTR
ncbi:ABC transporter permease subunit [Clostridium sp.]|uniref:ABC transporter permease subunit n=1 Tax=Clostridium sp. TaxID=1506 RepID=UPI002FC6BE75